MAKSGIYAFGVIYQTKVVYVYQDKIGHVEKGKISIWIRLSIFRVAGCFMNKRIGFIGCGNMGKAMLGSLVKSKDINNEDIKHIWDRFYKSDKSRTNKISTGLGLPIVRLILTQHNQDVWANNVDGKGIKFTFTLERSN